MIEKMLKLTLLVDEGRSRESLKALRKLGVLHVKPLANPPSGDMTEFESMIQDYQKAKGILGNTDKVKQSKHADPRSLLVDIIDTNAALEENQRELTKLESVKKWYENWSQLSLASVKELEGNGCFIRLYEASQDEWEQVSGRDDVFVVEESKSLVRLVHVSREDKRLSDLKPVAFPSLEYAELSKRISEFRSEIESLVSKIDMSKKYSDSLEKFAADIQSKYYFSATLNGMGNIENIAYVRGFIPAEKRDMIKKAAIENKWGYALEKPAEEDLPPTKLKNSEWIRIIEPVFDFLGIVPGYRERDISMFFLVFFSIFVSMIIGDAGYGGIFLILSIVLTIGSKKAGKKINKFNILLYVLSIGTIAWGSITGTWFGSVELAQLPFFRSLTIPQLSSFPDLYPEAGASARNNVQLICFVLAIIQLGMACIMNFINELPQLKSIAQLGWFSLLVGLFNLVLNLVLGMELLQISIYLVAGGLAAIIIFGEQEKGKNFFKGLIAGFGGAFSTFLDSISAFSNIISYIRLFAVGMASVAIAESFNAIASDTPFAAAVIILLIGHSLNIVMGLLSVIVHGIRLNVLEFSGQLGLEWAGHKYDPFKENK